MARLLGFATSRIDRVGAHATTSIPRGCTITFLTGEQVGRDEIFRRLALGKIAPDDPLQIGDDLFFDLDQNSFSINHSCEPNSGIRGTTELIAIRDIHPDEEITFDYSTTVSADVTPDSWTMRCRCGADRCRVVIGNVLSIPADQLAAYLEMGALPRYILAQLARMVSRPLNPA